VKKKIFIVLSVMIAVSVGFSACSRGSNDNAGNRPSNAATVPPTPADTPTPTPDNHGENVGKLIGDLASALMKGDTDALDKIYSDEYILITDTGQITTKPERIVMIKSGDLKFEKVDFEEISVRVYGNTAVAVARALAASTFKGKAQNIEERVTFVAVKDGDTWRFVSAQLTPIAAEPVSGNSKNPGGSNSATGANSSSGSTSSGNKQ
jgi:ketosteroid isomerase-like protein